MQFKAQTSHPFLLPSSISMEESYLSYAQHTLTYVIGCLQLCDNGNYILYLGQEAGIEGCMSYITYVKKVCIKNPLLDIFHIVHDLINVFPTNRPIFPLERDTDFSINLELST